MAISFTPAATGAALAALGQRGNGIGVRLCASTSGCSGLSYYMEFADELRENDECFALEEGLRLIVDTRHLTFMDGIVVDYLRQQNGEGFHISSPLLCGECECS